VNIQTALLPTIGTIGDTNDSSDKGYRHNLVVVAKHLCGVGTDLALKSIEPIRHSVTAVMMSTCCHGVCDWNDYVGRDYLLDVILSHDSNSMPTLSTFGNDEFDLMRLWSSGTVHDVKVLDTRNENDSTAASQLEDYDDLEDNVHPTPNEMLNESSSSGNSGCSNINVTKVVEALHLKCGAQGLGRACQRLIDYGRCEYLRHVIFNDQTDTTIPTTRIDDIQSNNDDDNNNSSTVELLYYVPESVTPQNALLIAYRSQ
jgi:tRNA:m4X modification enzyme